MLNDSNARQELAKQINKKIDEYAQETYYDGFRKHLGGSIIGDDCLRKIWYSFRWVKETLPEGRLLRLFNRGHLEEFRFVEYLRGIGFEVYEYSKRLIFNHAAGQYELLGWFSGIPFGPGENGNPDLEDVTNSPWHVDRAKEQGVKLEQFRISSCEGHFGGSLDGIAKPPVALGLPENTFFLLEFKTKSSKGFPALVKNRVIKEAPQHYAQMCVYGSDETYNLDYGLYMCVNKNTDEMHIEIVPLSKHKGDRMRKRAQDIVFASADDAPPKISQQPSYFKCTYCEFKDVCHDNAPKAKNCRSCRFALPGVDKNWACSNGDSDWYNEFLKDDVIAKGCHAWTPVD